VVKNTGNTTLTNVKVTDKAPAHVQFVSADKGTIANNAYSYTIPTLKVGQSVKLTITAKVTDYVEGSIKNTACVDAPAVPGSPDDCDDATVEVPPKPPVPGDITVCDLTTKEIITIKETAFDANKHSKDLSKCADTPVTPPELPHTGMSDSIFAFLGLGSLVASVTYYVISRRALGNL
jgi:LPXTG-motif cell wall-anchored protein